MSPSASPPGGPSAGLWVSRWAPCRRGCLISGSARCQAAGTAGSGQTGPATCLPALGRNAIHAPGAWLPREGHRAPRETHGLVAAQGTGATFPRPKGAGSTPGGALQPKPTQTQLDRPAGTPRPAGVRREGRHKRRRMGPGSLAVGPPPPGSPFSREQPQPHPMKALTPSHGSVSRSLSLGCPRRPQVLCPARTLALAG